MTKEKTIYLKVKSDGRICSSELGNLDLKIADEVLFEQDQSQETAYVVSEQCAKDIQGVESEIQGVIIIRKINEKDLEKIVELAKEARSYIGTCKEKIEKHGLLMELLDTELSYDGKKLTFYFTAPGRVDFRSLVPDLASTFKKLIRLQQVGSRDKAKYCGGVGRCGENLCCRNFLKGDLESVSMDMAYEQGLGQTGSNRVTGACGKLMCCLRFELDCYKNCKKKMPKIGE